LSEDVLGVIDGVRAQHLTYLEPRALRQLARAVRGIERRGVAGIMLEAGTALGGSAIVIAKSKAGERPLRLYDAFGMIPPPSTMDGADVHQRYRVIREGEAGGIGGEVYYGYRTDLLGDVRRAFTRFGLSAEENRVTIVPGLFEETLDVDEPVAFAHVDGDWYSSTMTCLERIVPHLAVGGRLIVDDYLAWSGCRRAVDEYFATDHGCELQMHARLHIVRVEEGRLDNV
jgi:predicted O-methyltransferase YrrM